MRQIFGDISWEKKALVFFVALAVLTFLGPFGSYESMDFPTRFVYWSALMIGVGFFMHVSMTTALSTPYLGKLPQFVRIGVGSVVAGLPGAAVVIFVNEVFWPVTITLTRIGSIWMQVALVGYVIGVVEYMQWGPTKNVEEKPKTTDFHKRLSASEKAEIISFSMQDHYVAVTTSEGSEMVLIRMSDAIKEVSAIAGARIHRSHWIAKSHLHNIEKDKARHLAVLSDGRKLPISNTYLDQAKALLKK